MISLYDPPPSKHRISRIRKFRTICIVLFVIVLILLVGWIIKDRQIKELRTTQPPEEAYISKPTLCETSLPAAPEDKPEPAEPTAVYLGTYTCYAYCACIKCTGKTPDDPAYGITASGAAATAGRTIAVDPDVIPLGSLLLVDGIPYIAEDTGDGNICGQALDIYFDDHTQAFKYGVQQHDVWIIQDAPLEGAMHVAQK